MLVNMPEWRKNNQSDCILWRVKATTSDWLAGCLEMQFERSGEQLEAWVAVFKLLECAKVAVEQPVERLLSLPME
jgi:hypothetical protein